MIRSTVRRLGVNSSSILASSTKKSSFIRPAPVLKRFGSDHAHHDEEYPAESLFNKTSIFLTVFTAVTVGLVVNDRFNSKNGKSMVGDWLIGSEPKTEEVIKNWEDNVELLEKERKQRILERSTGFKPSFMSSVLVKYVDPFN